MKVTTPARHKIVSLATLVFAITMILSCGKLSAPEYTDLIYDVTKNFSTGCGPNTLCIDFQGNGVFAKDAASCPTLCPNGTCPNTTEFYFDDSSWMSISVSTQMVFPPSSINLSLSETDSHSAPIQNPWLITLQPGATPQDSWTLTFRVKPQASTDLPLKPMSRIQGHYTLSVLGGFQVASATVEIHAETRASGGSLPTHLCSESE